MKVCELFDIFYGTNLALNHLKKNKNGINFVSRTEKNNGISAIVESIKNIKPLDAGLITIALGSSSVLSSFVQQKPFYTGFHVSCLRPKESMTLREKLFYCMCIRKNQYKYSYGRQANKTLQEIELPDNIPDWVYDIPVEKSLTAKPFHKKVLNLSSKKWLPFQYDRLFTVKRGKNVRVNQITDKGETRLISAVKQNNGLSGKVNITPQFIKNVISVNVNGNGGVGEAFYQNQPFCATIDVNVLEPKFDLNEFIAMFLICLIRKERFRYSFGRKWLKPRMDKSVIILPITSKNEPDWQFMEDYIKSLPYSKNLETSKKTLS